jgi:hypothetical protein
MVQSNHHLSHVAAWETALAGDFDREFLVEGFSTGFRVVPNGEVILPARVPNYHSCYNSVAMPRIDEQIHHEIAAGRYLEVESNIPFRIQAMEAIPKKNSTKIRIITDCSKPRGNCINDHIPLIYFIILHDPRSKHRSFLVFCMVRALSIDYRHCYYSIWSAL